MISTQKKGKWFANYSKKEIKKFPFVYLILAIPTIQIIIFFFYVNFSAIAMGFQNEYGEWSLESFTRVFDAFKNHGDSKGYDPWEMIWKSFAIWGNINVIGFIISILTSYILTKHMIGSKAFRLVYYIPSIVGPVIFSIVMKEMYAYNGIVTELLKKLGVDLPPLALRNGLLGAEETAFSTLMVQVFILSIAGGNMIMAGAYMKVPEEIFESAKLEGCGFFRETFQIAVPCIWPTISTLIIFSLCSIFTSDYSMYLYSNGSGANGMVSVGFYLYRYQVALTTVSDGTYIYGYISAFGIIITLVTLPIVLLGRKLLAKMQEPVEF